MPIKKKGKTKFKKSVESVTPQLVIKTKPEWIKNSLATKANYEKKYDQSIKNNDEFWRSEGKRIIKSKGVKVNNETYNDQTFSSKRFKWKIHTPYNEKTPCLQWRHDG